MSIIQFIHKRHRVLLSSSVPEVPPMVAFLPLIDARENRHTSSTLEQEGPK